MIWKSHLFIYFQISNQLLSLLRNFNRSVLFSPLPSQTLGFIEICTREIQPNVSTLDASGASTSVGLTLLFGRLASVRGDTPPGPVSRDPAKKSVQVAKSLSRPARSSSFGNAPRGLSIVWETCDHFGVVGTEGQDAPGKGVCLPADHLLPAERWHCTWGRAAETRGVLP